METARGHWNLCTVLSAGASGKATIGEEQEGASNPQRAYSNCVGCKLGKVSRGGTLHQKQSAEDGLIVLAVRHAPISNADDGKLEGILRSRISPFCQHGCLSHAYNV